MEDGNFYHGMGDGRPHFDSSSSDGEQQAIPPVAPHGRESVDEAASAAGRTESTPTTSSCSGSICSKRGLRSWVWKHFTHHKDYKDKNGNLLGPKATCNYCETMFSGISSHGVGSHSRHLRNKHREKLIDETGSSGTVSNFVYSKERMRHGLAVYVAVAEQPLTFGDDVRLEYFLKTCLNPSFSKVSRNTTRNDLKKTHAEVKNVFISDFSKLGTIAFTSDMWSGCNNCGYASVTAHYVDSSWTLQSKIIGFRLVEYPHDADQIFETIMGVFTEYGVSGKVLSITFDNHSANTRSIPMFENSLTSCRAGVLLHMRCVCHIINLVVQDGLKHIGPHMQKIRAAVLYISTSGARQQEFNKMCASRFNLKPKSMKADAPHRWNSTYLMLKSCRKHHDAITAFVNSQYHAIGLSTADWKIAFEFMNFLKVFYGATVACSGFRYPTTCLVLRHLYNISLNFRNYREKPNFIHACVVMEEKFRKYFEIMPPIFILAAVMDPRIKLAGVEVLLRELGNNLAISTLPSFAYVTDSLTMMYASYESRSSTTVVSTASTLPSSSNDASLFLLSSTLGVGRSSVTSRSKLFKYLDLEYVVGDELLNFDILAWWKTKELTYPILSIMACDLLTPPVSSVASESCFSAAKRVLDDKRSRLAPDILECLICLKDWEDARLGIQKVSAKDEFRGYFADSDIDSD